LILPLTLLLASCEIGNEAIDYSTDENLYEYELEYPKSFILWDQLLSQNNDEYFAYVFSYDCFYCKEVKSEIISFYDLGIYPIYFIEYNNKVPIEHNTLLTIGEKDINNVFIRGTPSLLFIKKGEIFLNAAGKKEVLETIDLIKNQ